MSDAPTLRTDEIEATCQSFDDVQWGATGWDFARQLERELAEALKQRDEWFEVFKKNLKEKGNLSDQLAEAREKVTTAWTENIILDSRNRQLERELSDMTQRRDELLASLEKVAAYLSPPPSGE